MPPRQAGHRARGGCAGSGRPAGEDTPPYTPVASGPDHRNRGRAPALGVAVVSDPTTIAAAPKATPATMRTTAAAANPSGYVQLFMGASLRSSASEAATAQAGPAQSLGPDVELPNRATHAHDAHARLESVTAVRSTQHRPRRLVETLTDEQDAAYAAFRGAPSRTERERLSFPDDADRELDRGQAAGAQPPGLRCAAGDGAVSRGVPKRHHGRAGGGGTWSL